MPFLRPRCCLRNFTFFGINIRKISGISSSQRPSSAPRSPSRLPSLRQRSGHPRIPSIPSPPSRGEGDASARSSPVILSAAKDLGGGHHAVALRLFSFNRSPLYTHTLTPITP